MILDLVAIVLVSSTQSLPRYLRIASGKQMGSRVVMLGGPLWGPSLRLPCIA